MEKPALVLFSFTLSLILPGCHEDQPVAPAEKTPSGTVTEIIGPAGGRVLADGFTLAVPQGAFASVETLRVTIEAASTEFAADAFTPLYRLNGLPTDYALPLRVELEARRMPTPGIFLVVGLEARTPLEGETVELCDDIPSDYNNGVLGAQLPPPPAALTRLRGTPALPRAESLAIAKWFVGIDNTDTLMSEAGHFRVLYRRYMKGSARGVAAHYENAYEASAEAGFDQDGLFTSIAWPVRIDIRNLCCQKSQGLVATGLRPELMTGRTAVHVALDECKLVSGSFPLNTTLALSFTSALGGVRLDGLITQYPEFSPDQRAQYAWLVTSVAEWAQELVLWEEQRPFFAAPAFAPRWMVPFHGLPLPQGFSVNDHGIGWIPLMKHLADSCGGDQTVTTAFHELLEQPNGVDALLSSASEPEEVWFPAFVRRYVAGELCGVKADTFLQSVGSSDLWAINGSQDTARTFSAAYPDLSARLFRVNLRYQGLGDDASIRFTVGPPSLLVNDAQVLVFALKGGMFEFRDAGTELTVTDAKALSDAGYDLLAVLVNSWSASPHTGKRTIDLHVYVTSAVPARVGV